MGTGNFSSTFFPDSSYLYLKHDDLNLILRMNMGLFENRAPQNPMDDDHCPQESGNTLACALLYTYPPTPAMSRGSTSEKQWSSGTAGCRFPRPVGASSFALLGRARWA